MPVLLSPSLLSADFSKLGEEIQAIERAGADWIHWDIMDSHFVPGLTFGPPVIQSLRPLCPLPFDAHLMVSQPENLIEPMAKAGVNLLTFHLEASSEPERLIENIKSLNMKAGVSIKPQTAAEKLFPILEALDLILIMTVEPGRAGQKFLDKPAEKAFLLKEKISRLNKPPLISVDGGITPETAARLKGAADVLVSGNYIFKSKNYAAAAAELRKSA